MYFLVVGCGICGAIIARELAEDNHQVEVIDKRNHIGGNLYDYYDEYGILVQKYGPHTVHTNNKRIIDYISKYGKWEDYELKCGASWSGICSPTPFNFKTIDMYYSVEDAELLKKVLLDNYPSGEAFVLSMMNSSIPMIREYADFLYRNDYAPYTAKQWNLSPKEIDPSVLKRVPVRFSYREGYFNDKYQVMPEKSFTTFFENLLDHQNITVNLNIDALDVIEVTDEIIIKGRNGPCVVIYTGPLDQLFSYQYGRLPYRSLKFVWKHENIDSFQKYPVVAYPQDKEIVRITEYSKLPVQTNKGTTYAMEYSLPVSQEDNEPYYPVLTDESKKLFEKYSEKARSITNLYCCGRLADFKYYNIDEASERALKLVDEIKQRYRESE